MRFDYAMYWDGEGRHRPVSATIDIEGFSAEDYLIAELRRTGSFYEDDLLEHVALRGPRGGVFVDVGAHVGNHAVYFGRFLPGHVVAIEANPALVPFLRRNLNANAVQNYSVVSCAVGARPALGRMYYPETSGGNTGGGRVAIDRSSAGMPGDADLVPVKTLDGVLEELAPRLSGLPPAFVKIDIEGMEFEALEGGAATLEQYHPQLAVELPRPEAREAARAFLARFGYRDVGHFGKTTTVYFINPQLHELRPLPSAPAEAGATNRFHRATLEIAALVPRGDRFIVVGWGGEVVAGRHAVPLPECDGGYWGPPADDASAMAEFERLRGSGATFLVVAWPAFWWLEYYREFERRLRSGFRCVLENDRLVVFDLRS